MNNEEFDKEMDKLVTATMMMDTELIHLQTEIIQKHFDISKIASDHQMLENIMNIFTVVGELSVMDVDRLERDLVLLIGQYGFSKPSDFIDDLIKFGHNFSDSFKRLKENV